MAARSAFSFEVFEKRTTPPSRPFVTIQKRGLISISRGAHELIGAPESVQLLFDPHRRVMGLRAAEPWMDNAYQVRGLKKSNGTRIVAGTAFTRYYDIDTERSRRWLAFLDGDVLCIDLSQPGEEVVSGGSDARARPARGR
jgi:hypothetical protein